MYALQKQKQIKTADIPPPVAQQQHSLILPPPVDEGNNINNNNNNQPPQLESVPDVQDQSGDIKQEQN